MNRRPALPVLPALLLLVMLLAGASLAAAMEQAWLPHFAAPPAAVWLRVATIIELVALGELLRLPLRWLAVALPFAFLSPEKYAWGAAYVCAVLLLVFAAWRRARLPVLVVWSLALLAVIPWLMLHGSWGDEWEYLLLLDSLATDADLNVANQFAANDFLRYGRHLRLPDWYAGSAFGLTPHVLTFGYLAALLPGWLLLGRYGVHLLHLVAALGLWFAVQRYTRFFPVSGPGALLLLTTLPLLPYTFHVYPEIMAALLLTVVLVRLGAQDEPRVTALLIGLLPWLNNRYLLLALPLAGLLWWRTPAAQRRVPLALLIALGAVLGILQAPYVALLPGAGTETAYFSWRVHIGVFGNLCDGEYGILPYAPLWLFAGIGVLRLWRSSARPRLLEMLVAAGPYLLVMCAYERFWYGGQSPPARFVAVLLPLCVPLVLAGIPPLTSRCRVLWRAALAWSWGMALLLLLVPSWRFNVRLDGHNAVLQAVDALTGSDVAWLLPSWRTPDDLTWPLTGLWLLLALVLLLVCWRDYGHADV